jgi:Arc/MetJ-type ribon-helix-helix transcriptional regulator
MAVVTIRLDAEAASDVERSARACGQTKSEFIRAAVEERVRKTSRRERKLTAYDRLKDFIGSCSSGGANYAVDTGRKYAEMLEEERRAKNADRRRSSHRARRRA